MLGVRPEDMAVVESPTEASMKTPIYSVELTGESTLLTVRVADNLVTLRTNNDFDGNIDDEVLIKINAEKIFLFDEESKQRVSA